MEIKEKIQFILNSGGRGSGRTQAMIDGVKNNPKIVVVAASEAHAKHLRPRLPNHKVIGLDSLDNQGGRQEILIADHFAWEYLIWEMLRVEENKKGFFEKKGDLFVNPRISDCCQAPLLPGETPMCSDCREHCGVVDLNNEKLCGCAQPCDCEPND